MLNMKFYADSGIKEPCRATPGSAGFDIFAPYDFVIPVGKSVHIDLGFATEIPEGYAAFILPRSGSGTKFGVALANTIGLIDNDYRNNWLLTLWQNQHGIEEPGPIFCKKGQSIAQFAVLPFIAPALVRVDSRDELSKTYRQGGLGSTDILDQISHNP